MNFIYQKLERKLYKFFLRDRHKSDFVLQEKIVTKNRLPSKKEMIETFKYWRDVSECECDSKLPPGGCFRCDVEKVIEFIEQLEDK